MANHWSDNAKKFIQAVPLNETACEAKYDKSKYMGIQFADELNLDMALEAIKALTLDALLAELGFDVSMFDNKALGTVLLAALDKGLVGEGEMVNNKRCVCSTIGFAISQTAPSMHVARNFYDAGYFPNPDIASLDKNGSLKLESKLMYFVDNSRHDDLALYIEQGYKLRDSYPFSSLFSQDVLGDDDSVIVVRGGEDADIEGLKRLLSLDTRMKFVAVDGPVYNEIVREQLLYALNAGFVPVPNVTFRNILNQRIWGPKKDAVRECFLWITRTYDAELIDAAIAAIENSPFEPKLYLDVNLGKLEGRDDLAGVLSRHPDMVDPSTVVQGELWCEEDSAVVQIPKEITSVQPLAFANYDNYANFAEAMSSIGKKAISIKKLFLPETLEIIGNRAFYNNVPECVRLPKSLQEVGYESLHGSKIIYIYDQADEKPQRKTKAAQEIPSMQARIGSMNSGNHDDAVSYEVIVMDKSTDQVKYRVCLPLKDVSELLDRTLRKLWKNVATYSFYAFDAHFSSWILKKAIAARLAVYRLAYPIELEDQMRNYYASYLKNSDKSIHKGYMNALETLLLTGGLEAVRSVCRAVPLDKSDANKLLKAVQKSKDLKKPDKEEIVDYLEAIY